MNKLVIYFSLTGNTRKVALAIQKGIKQDSGQCDTMAMNDVNPMDLAKYDLIGLGSPVWRRNPPPNFLSFIDYALGPCLKGKNAFVFCTHGAIPGGFIPTTLEALQRKGLTIVGWNDWYGSCKLQYQPQPYYTEGHPDAIDLREAETFGTEIANRSRRISQGETGIIPEMPKTEYEWAEIYGLRQERVSMPPGEMSPTSLDFTINTEKCTKCMICANNCPTNSINFSVSPPIIMNNCIKCFFCELICPEGAIETDWAPVNSALKVTAKARIEAQLKIDSSRGRFRALIPFDEVNWGEPFYKNSGYPRFQIDT